MNKFIVNESNQPPSVKSTILVTGASRGGTSAIALLLKNLGVNMGETASKTHEDPAIGKNISNKQKLKDVIRAKNKQHQLWGFKLPAASYLLNFFDGTLRNPRIIIIYRNPHDVAMSKLKRNESLSHTSAHYYKAMEQALSFYNTIVQSLKRVEAPTMLVSYEDLLHDTKEVVNAVVEFLPISPTEQQKQAAITGCSSKGYKKLG